MFDENAAPLLQFRAGRADYKNGVVTPQEPKGTLSVYPARDPAKALLLWAGAETQTTFLLPKVGVTVKFVEKCTTGRVLLFEESPTQRTFFWLQEKNTANDSNYLKKLKEIFTSEPSASEQSTPQVGLNDFKKLLASISAGGKSKVDIEAILSSSRLADIVNADADFYMSRLSAHLPPGSDTANITGQLQNPQILKCAKHMDAALAEPAAYRELCKAFGIPEEDGQVGTEGFLSALQKSAKK